MFETLKNAYPKAFSVVSKVHDIVKDKYAWELNEEEMVYLMMHVNRLCSREDCYQ